MNSAVVAVSLQPHLLRIARLICCSSSGWSGHRVRQPRDYQPMTLAVAIAGLVVAVSSLVWQAVSWSYTGARVRVRVSNGITAYGPEPVVVAIVEANNLGRSAVEITGWGLVLSGGGTFVMPRALPGNTATPSTLAGGHRASVLVPFGYLARPEVLT